MEEKLIKMHSVKDTIPNHMHEQIQHSKSFKQSVFSPKNNLLNIQILQETPEEENIESEEQSKEKGNISEMMQPLFSQKKNSNSSFTMLPSSNSQRKITIPFRNSSSNRNYSSKIQSNLNLSEQQERFTPSKNTSRYQQFIHTSSSNSGKNYQIKGRPESKGSFPLNRTLQVSSSSSKNIIVQNQSSVNSYSKRPNTLRDILDYKSPANQRDSSRGYENSISQIDSIDINDFSFQKEQKMNSSSSKKSNKKYPFQISPSLLSTMVTSPTVAPFFESLKKSNSKKSQMRNSLSKQNQQKRDSTSSIVIVSPKSTSDKSQMQTKSFFFPKGLSAKKLQFQPQSQSNLQTKMAISSSYFEEMSENFKSSFNLIDRNEMKKFILSQEEAPLLLLEPSTQKKPQIFKPNIPAAEQKLKDRKHTQILLRMNEFTYFCLQVKGKYSPLRLRVKAEQSNLIFKLLASRESQTPSQFNCDFNMTGSVFSLESGTNPMNFDVQDYFYFALFSSSEQIVSISYRFGAENMRLQREREDLGNQEHIRSSRERKYKFNDLTNQQLKEEVKRITHQRKMALMTNLKGDGTIENMVLKNIEKTRNDIFKQSIKARIASQEAKKIKQALILEQKSVNEENHFLQLSSQIEEKIVKKQTNLINKMKEIKKFQKSTFDFFWLTNIVLVIMVKRIADKMKRYRERQRLLREMAFSLARPFTKYRTKMRKMMGANIQSRSLIDSIYTLQIYAQVKRKEVKKKAENTLCYVLQCNMWRSAIFQKVNIYVNTAIKIISRLQKFHFKVKNFKKLLYKIWERRYQVLIQEIIDVKLEYGPFKDPTMSKRYVQNMYQSFNQIDFKKQAIEGYYLDRLEIFLNSIKTNNSNLYTVIKAKRNSIEEQQFKDYIQKSMQFSFKQVTSSSSVNTPASKFNQIARNISFKNKLLFLFNANTHDQDQPCSISETPMNNNSNNNSNQKFNNSQSLKNQLQTQQTVVNQWSQLIHSPKHSNDGNKNKLDNCSERSNSEDESNNNDEDNQQQQPLYQQPVQRLFILPTNEQLKKIIYQVAKNVAKQYPELVKKVNFKYTPPP